MEALIHLDTHVAVWLYAGDAARLAPVMKRLSTSRLRISPMVPLELQYLFEVGRVGDPAGPVVTELRERFGVEVSATPFARVVRAALALAWTRDPFDRLIAGQAAAENVPLLTKDETVLAAFPLAVWP